MHSCHCSAIQYTSTSRPQPRHDTHISSEGMKEGSVLKVLEALIELMLPDNAAGAQQVHELEVELARTKLALVEAECKCQQLTHDLSQVPYFRTSQSNAV